MKFEEWLALPELELSEKEHKYYIKKLHVISIANDKIANRIDTTVYMKTRKAGERNLDLCAMGLKSMVVLGYVECEEGVYRRLPLGLSEWALSIARGQTIGVQLFPGRVIMGITYDCDQACKRPFVEIL